MLMRLTPVFLASVLLTSAISLHANVVVLQAPEGDTVMGVVQASLIALRDTIGQGGEATATAREGESFQLLIGQDGWYQVVHPKGVLWTPQNGIRVTTAKMLRSERIVTAHGDRQRIRWAIAAGVLTALMLLLLFYLIQRRRLQEVRRRWILLATRHDSLEEDLAKAGWDVQKLPQGTRIGEFFSLHPTVVVADQPSHGHDISSLEAHNASVASTPILWLDSTVVERVQDPLRAFLSPGAKVSAILETVQRLAQAVPGPEQLSRRAEIEGKLGHGRLLELLHFLASARRTGRVEVRTTTDQAWMWFEDGQLRHALAGELSGIPAMYHCLDLERGTFAFCSGVTAPEKSVRENTITLLHEYARIRDEHGKISRA